MEAFEKQGGISFFIIYFSARNELYYMTFQEMKMFWERAQKGGRKSFRYEELNSNFFMQLKNGFMVPYLDGIQKDLELRE